MNAIKITNDPREMVTIAKEIVAEKQAKYDAGLMDLVIADVKKRLPQASEAELMEQVYITIYHYWVYGASTDEYFYYEFANKTHEEKQRYMTFRERMIYIDHINQKEYAHLLFNKFETYALFKEEFKRDMIKCSGEEDEAQFLAFSEKHPVFVVKPTDLSGGRGIRKASVSGLNEKEKHAFFLELLKEGRASKARYQRGGEGTIVLEELIDQDERLGVFNPESVNGIRLVMVTQNGEPRPYEAWLKIGRGGHFLTSAVFGTLDAGINLTTGEIDTDGFTENGEVFQRHPDTGVVFKGFQIPQWEALIEFAKACSKKVPYFNYIGWDFALAKSGWCVMEGNYCGDFMWQLYRQRGMKKDFEDLIGWKLDKEFWWQEL